MIARFTGATLGLLAFTVAALGGMWVGNPVTVTLSRAIWSLVIFCLIGLLVGGAAQAVVNDYARRRLEAGRSAAESPSMADHPSASAGEAVMSVGPGAVGK